ncbi:MAG: hypothetical protein GY807_04555 [Gammaproteobacteria bacterium]|nr:hypothetical protein [Gammaproteobacteria bacterium]
MLLIHTENCKTADFGKIGNFHDDDCKPYTVWNFPKATNRSPTRNGLRNISKFGAGAKFYPGLTTAKSPHLNPTNKITGLIVSPAGQFAAAIEA